MITLSRFNLTLSLFQFVFLDRLAEIGCLVTKIKALRKGLALSRLIIVVFKHINL